MLSPRTIMHTQANAAKRLGSWCDLDLSVRGYLGDLTTVKASASVFTINPNPEAGT